jgi:hypothetical protein
MAVLSLSALEQFNSGPDIPPLSTQEKPWFRGNQPEAP